MNIKRIFAATVIASLSVFLYLQLRPRTMGDEDAKAIANWLRSAGLKTGQSNNVALPASLSAFSTHGCVDVMLLKNGKLAYFLKSTEGFKGNYQGYIYADSGFPLVIAPDVTGRQTVGIFGLGGGDSYVTVNRKISNNLYAVFSDWG